MQYTELNTESSNEVSDMIVSSIDKHVGNYESSSRAIKEIMDKKFGDSWNVIVGEGFSFEITHQAQFIIYIYYQNLAVLVFKN